MSNELTQDRIKAAIDFISDHLADLQYGDDDIDQSWPQSEQEAYVTILAALDAVRWRDMATEPPTFDERCRILVIFKGERGEGKPVMLTYNPEEGPYFNKFEDSHFINTRYSPTDGEESYGLPDCERSRIWKIKMFKRTTDPLD